MCVYRYTHAHTFCQKVENVVYIEDKNNDVNSSLKIRPYRNTGNAEDLHYAKCSSP